MNAPVAPQLAKYFSEKIRQRAAWKPYMSLEQNRSHFAGVRGVVDATRLVWKVVLRGNLVWTGGAVLCVGKNAEQLRRRTQGTQPDVLGGLE